MSVDSTGQPFLKWVGTTGSKWTSSNFGANPMGPNVPGSNATCAGGSGNLNDPDCQTVVPVHGLLGPSYSSTSMNTAAIFGTFNMPLMTSYATNPLLSVKSGNNAYPNYFRACAPDSFRMQVTAKWL